MVTQKIYISSTQILMEINRMKKIIILTITLLFFTGCKINNGVENVPTTTLTDSPTMEDINTTTPIITEMPESITEPIFNRIDYNLAEFAIYLSEPYKASITKVILGEQEVISFDAYFLYYLYKDYLGSPSVNIVSQNLYGTESGGGGTVDRNIDGHHIFVSKHTEGEYVKIYFSRRITNNNETYYRLYCIADLRYEDPNLENCRATNIKKFLESKDNKIYYQDLDGDVFSFEMTTMEVETVDDYEVVDYSTIPDDVIDYTMNKTLIYDNEYDVIFIYDSEIINGDFIVNRESGYVKYIDVLKTGELVDVKAVNNYIFFIIREGNNKTVLYRYDMGSSIYLKLYETDKEFDASYATVDDYFAAFYDGNYNIEAVKYNFDNQDTRLIYDDKTCINWNHVANGETDDIVEEYRYADINYMVYKGNVLFGFNIDDAGITTLVFRTEVIDRELLPKIEE